MENSCTPAFALANSAVMLSDEMPEMKSLGPKALKGSPVTIHLYVKDVDAFSAQAVAAGAKNYHARAGYVLGRSLRAARRSVWSSLVRRYSHSGRQPGGDADGHAEDEPTDVILEGRGLICRVESSLRGKSVSRWL